MTPTTDAERRGAEPAYPTQGQRHVNADGIELDPYGGYGWIVEPAGGLTKREAFAMAAMQGMLSASSCWPVESDADRVAFLSYAMADAHLSRSSLNQEPRT